MLTLLTHGGFAMKKVCIVRLSEEKWENQPDRSTLPPEQNLRIWRMIELIFRFNENKF